MKLNNLYIFKRYEKSTVREAADKDYRITVLSDCCGDRDEEVHRVLITKVFPRQADVLTVGEWASLLLA